MLVRPRLVRSDFWFLLVAAGVMLLLNTFRLAAYAASFSAYEYWHHGAGHLLLAILQTVMVLAMAVLIAKRNIGEPA